MTEVDVKGIAGKVAEVDEEIMKLFPYISTIIGFVPGAQAAVPFLPIVGEILAAIDQAAKDINNGNPGSAVEDILTEIRNHLQPGKPNSAILSSPLVPSAGITN